jgi:hypothetical protein
VVLDGCKVVYSKGRGVVLTTFSSAARLLCRRRRSNPKVTKMMRARPPITLPTITPTGVLELSPGVDVPVEEDTDVAVVDGSVPFWTIR